VGAGDFPVAVPVEQAAGVAARIGSVVADEDHGVVLVKMIVRW